MDDPLRVLIGKLPGSPFALTEKHKKKIHQYLPVPTDHQILWADMLSFGGYPCGIVLTDQGLVFKAPKSVVREENARRENEQSEDIKTKKTGNALKTIYQIIPWEYYDPASYIAQKVTDGRYVLKINDTELTVFSCAELYHLFNDYAQEDDRIRQQTDDLVKTSTFTGLGTVDLENTAYHAAYGADQSNSGHGNYAEDAGVLLDRLAGNKATGAGRDIDPSTNRYIKNGPDKFVNNTPIQCKYYKTAGSSVRASFSKNPVTGKLEYRYFGLDGKTPMPTEVARDQYSKAVEAMRKRIENGQVLGVTDPKTAEQLIRKGILTSKQARNLAKAGTFESLSYDAVTGVVSCSVMCGISALASFGLVYWQTKDIKKASNAALTTGIQVFGPAFAGRILAAQIARSGLSNAIMPATETISKTLNPQTIQRIVNAFRQFANKKAIYGAAAQKSFAKALRTTAVTQVAMFVIMPVPDTVRLTSKKMTGAQYTKNMTSMVSSFLGYAASSYGAGVALGKVAEKYGEVVNGKTGKAIGFAAGLVGGAGGSMVVRGIGNLIKEDDAVITARLFNATLGIMCMDYLLSESEVDAVIQALDSKSKEIGKLQRSLIASPRQYREIEKFLTPIFENVIAKRETISTELEEKMAFEIDESIAAACAVDDIEEVAL